MKMINSTRVLGVCLLAGVAAVASQPAAAFEGLTPYMPGVSVGSAAGALPPPGTYFADDNVWVIGGSKDNNGNSVPVNVWLNVNIPSVLWVPNFQVLGATYGVALVQPYVFKGVDATGAGGRATISNGLFNTIIQPIGLSWKLPQNLFASFALGIYLPDGYYVHQTSATGAQVTGQPSVANNFTTFEPNVALSWLANGWNLTLHAVVDVSTENTTTNYQSGNIFYLDYTVAKSFGKWTFGGGGNYTKQFSNDTINGAPVNGNGNELEHVLLGPLVSYDFGPVNIAAKALFGIEAKNDANVSFYHISFAFPF
jgi:hypothetical protein